MIFQTVIFQTQLTTILHQRRHCNSPLKNVDSKFNLKDQLLLKAFTTTIHTEFETQNHQIGSLIKVRVMDIAAANSTVR